jgi:hypothetical protein
MMEFGDTWAHEGISEATKKALKARGITGVRADDKRYHDPLYFNVLTYMHGCSMGVAVHDRIKAEAQNPNVALEAFDTLNPSETIPPPVSKWLSDKGLG